MLEGLTLTSILTAAGSSVVVPFVNKILGPGADEIGTMIAERARLYRLQNTFIFFRKAQEMVASAGFDPKQVNLKTLLPLIEGASIEDDSSLSHKWATLLVNAADPASALEIKPAYAEILKQLTPREAKLLDQLFIKSDMMNPLVSGEKFNNQGYATESVRKARALSMMIDIRHMRYDEKRPGDLSALHEFDAMIDNLLRQRLIVPAKPQPPKQKPGVYLTDYEPKTDRVFFSSLGFDFMLACIPPSYKVG